MTAHPQPLLLISFEDPGDVRRVWEQLRHSFKCELEAGGILMIDRTEGGVIMLGRDERADQAYAAVSSQVGAELARLEAQGSVPTLAGKHRSRPSPNELEAWAKVFGWLLVEDPAGGDAGKRVAAHKVVAAVNERLIEEGLEGHLVRTTDTRRLYSALRECVPDVVIEQDPSGGRTYIRGVDWSPEALQWQNLPRFKAPYS